MTDQNLKPGDNQLVNSRGRARGLIEVWGEMRWMRNRIWLSTYPTLCYGRAATLVLLSKMVVQNARAPGLRHPQPMGRVSQKQLIVHIIQSLVWAEQEPEILAPTHVLLTPYSIFPISDLSAFVGAGLISLPYLIQQRLPHLLVLTVLTWTQTQPPVDLYHWRL